MKLKILEWKECFKWSKQELLKRNNTLELEVQRLQNIIKDDLYKTFMDKLEEPQELQRLKRENTNLRRKNKVLRQLLKDDHKNGG